MVPFIAAKRGGSPQQTNVPQQVIIDVAQLKSAVDVDLPEPITPKKLAQLEEQRKTGKVAKQKSSVSFSSTPTKPLSLKELKELEASQK